jgi:spore coat protein U-like protein
MNHSLSASIALVAGLAFSAMASAVGTTTATGSFQAKIQITANCAVGTSNPDLDFGSTASTTTTALSATNAGITVTCTNLTPYNIGLQSAASGSATDGTGTMKATVGGTDYTVGYALFNGSTAWGNNTGTTGGNTVSAVGTGIVQTFPVSGKTTTTLNVPVATYTDTVTVSVYY